MPRGCVHPCGRLCRRARSSPVFWMHHAEAHVSPLDGECQGLWRRGSARTKAASPFARPAVPSCSRLRERERERTRWTLPARGMRMCLTRRSQSGHRFDVCVTLMSGRRFSLPPLAGAAPPLHVACMGEHRSCFASASGHRFSFASCSCHFVRCTRGLNICACARRQAVFLRAHTDGACLRT